MSNNSKLLIFIVIVLSSFIFFVTSSSWQPLFAHQQATLTQTSLQTIGNLQYTIANDHFIYLPLVSNQISTTEWNIECIDCPASFWSMSDRSIRLDSNGYPHIAYGGNHLFYIWFDGSSWHKETIDGNATTGTTPSLVLDSNDNPHISYVDWDDTPPYQSTLNYAYKSGTGWHVDLLDEIGASASSVSLDLDSNDFPHIGYYDESEEAYKYVYWTGNNWNPQTIFSSVHPSFPSISIVLDSADHPHIGFSKPGLRYAHWTGTDWQTGNIATGGRNISIALDKSEMPVFSHYTISGPSSSTIQYTHWVNDHWEDQELETIPGDGYAASTSIEIDSQNQPHIVYTDFSYAPKLKYAYWTNNEWHIEAVYISTPVCGPSSLALDNNDLPHIACQDRDQKGLVYAYLKMNK